MYKRIAVIGSGISGLSTAYLLKDKYHVTLYEKDSRLGGHSRSITVTKNDYNILVDTGFIVLNDRNYPHLNSLFKKLDIALKKTEMSFAVSVNKGQIEWSGNSLNTVFSQRKNIFNPTMIKGVLDILKFNKKSLFFLVNSPHLTLGELVKTMNLGPWFIENYIVPMAASIWSCSHKKIMDFPAKTLIDFFDNHGLLGLNNRPQWYTLSNRSIEYVNLMERFIKEKAVILKNAAIGSVTRENGIIRIQNLSDKVSEFDEVVFACHPVDILMILKDPTCQEKRMLSRFSQEKNTAYTHNDCNQMPKLRKCWSSWNCLYDKSLQDKPVSVTYWMNKLQHIDQDFPLFVTLNPIHSIPEDRIYDCYDFLHPVFDFQAMLGKEEMLENQGVNHLWFCGAYLRNGFHEDGIFSAIKVVEALNKEKSC